MYLGGAAYLDDGIIPSGFTASGRRGLGEFDCRSLLGGGGGGADARERLVGDLEVIRLDFNVPACSRTLANMDEPLNSGRSPIKLGLCLNLRASVLRYISVSFDRVLQRNGLPDDFLRFHQQKNKIKSEMSTMQTTMGTTMATVFVEDSCDGLASGLAEGVAAAGTPVLLCAKPPSDDECVGSIRDVPLDEALSIEGDSEREELWTSDVEDVRDEVEV